jgi:hypothetical protein
MKEEKGQYEILLVLEEDRYNNLLEICRKYEEQQDTERVHTNAYRFCAW